jgi:hypothetical protein
MIEMEKPGAARGLAAVEHELHEEKAVALGRVARALESHLNAMARFARELGAPLPVDERKRRVAAYQEHRKQAQLFRWYLEVQREALGLRNHDALDAHYRIPPEIHG